MSYFKREIAGRITRSKRIFCIILRKDIKFYKNILLNSYKMSAFGRSHN